MPRKAPPRLKVPLFQQPMRNGVVEDGATVGAVVGVNLYDTAGELVDLQALIAAEVGALTAGGSGLSPTSWPLILDVPPNVEGLAELDTNGYIVRKADGSIVTRTVEGVAGETTSAEEDGDTGNATIGLWTVGVAAALGAYRVQLDTKGRVIGYDVLEAADVSVDPAGWTEISGTDVQAAFDATDAAIAAVAAAALPDAPSDGTTYGRLNGAWSAAQPLATILTGLAGMGAGVGMVEQTGAATFAKRALGVGASTSILTRADGDGRYILASEKGAALGVAPLDAGGKLDATYLPPIAVTDTFVVASQAAMLALTAEVGDVAVRTDINETFILATSPPTVLANWVQLLFPGAAVSSVFGRTGAVTALVGDYSAYYDLLGSAAAAQAASQPLDGDLTAIAGLTPVNDDVIQRKAGAWVNRTLAQLLTDLNLGALYQPLASILTNIAAIGAPTGLIEKTGAASVATRALGVGTAAAVLTRADGDGRYDALGSAAAAQAASQPLLSLAANTFYARSSAGAAANKTITDNALAFNAAATLALMRTAIGLGTGDSPTFTAATLTGSGLVANGVFLTPGSAPGVLANGWVWYDSGAANVRAYIGGATRDLWHSGNLLNIGTTAATARTALVLGTAAVENTGTSGGTIPFCNGANTWGNSQTFAGGNSVYTVTNFVFLADTADASDTKSMTIAGGGNTPVGRGASVSVYGNEHASFPGQVRLVAGNASSIIGHVGSIIPESNNAYALGSSSFVYSAIYVTTAADGTNTTAGASTAYAMKAAPNASYRNLFEREGSHTALRATGTYAVPSGDACPVSGTGTLYPWGVFYLDPADFPTVNGLTTKLRVRFSVTVNDTAPAATFIGALHPVTHTGATGAAGLGLYAIGAAVAGSAATTITTPAADSQNPVAGADFAIPAAGWYCLGFVQSGGAIAASSHLFITAQLQLRNT